MIEATLRLDGHAHEVRLEETEHGWVAHVDGVAFPVRTHRKGTQMAVSAGGHVHVVDLRDAHTAIIDGQDAPFYIERLVGVAGSVEETGLHGPVRPPMTGRVEAISVQSGDTVERGQVLFVLEAMKMRNEVKAPAAGVIGDVHAAPGDNVDTGTVVLELLPA